MRESLALLVRAEGLDVETFASAREFLRRPPSEGPSCLVVDFSLVDGDLAFQERISRDRLAHPVIFIMGYGDLPAAVEAATLDAVAFLGKPFDVDALLGAIHDALLRSAGRLTQTMKG